MDADVYKCRSCGAGVAPSARRCAHCDALVASLRCGACFHMNVPEAIHCSGCGRELGLEPIAQQGSLKCPNCKTMLAVIESDAGVLHDCDRCGGQFVEQALLSDLLTRPQQLGALELRAPARSPLAAGSVHYVPCPACGVLMTRKNFGGSSGVVVDVCRRHGVWFDQGELPRVLSFVQSGGLAKAGAPRLVTTSGASGVHYAMGHDAETRAVVGDLESVDAIADAVAGFFREVFGSERDR